MTKTTKGPKTHHIVPHPEGGWDVRLDGADRASSHHAAKRGAISSHTVEQPS